MSGDRRYVIVAEFTVRVGRIDDFLDLMRRHAEASRAEPGCLTFDVAQDAVRPAHVLLYEVYADATAYAAHRETPHYARFRTLAADLVETGPEGLFRRRSVMTRIA